VAQLLPRNNARRQLQEAIAQKPITLLCGGAGIGKSCLLEEVFTIDGFVDESSCVVIRFTKRDHTVKAFLRRFAIVLNLYELPDLSRPEQMAGAINALPEGIVLVIDDFHELGHKPQFAGYLAKLIELTTRHGEKPPRRWVVAIRQLDELPQGILMAQNRLSLLNANEILAVQDRERDGMYALRGITHQPNVYGSMRTIMLSLGFIMANDLGYMGKRSDLPVAPTHGHRHKSGHRHVEKLVQRLNRSLQEFLYTTCLLDEIDLGDLLETNDLDPKALEKLAKIGLLHYDAVLGGLRYDDTVTDYLQETLNYCSTSIIERASRHAAHAGTRRADVMHGFKALVSHQAWDSILSILERYGLTLLDHEPVHGSVAFALQSLPDEVVQVSPVAAGIFGAMTARVGFGDVAESWFQNSLNMEGISQALRHQIGFRYALEVIRRERGDAIDLIGPLYEELESDPALDPDLRALVRIARAVVATHHHNDAEATFYLNQAIEADTLAYDDATHARVHHGAAYVLIRLGMPEMAIQLADKAIEFAVRDGFYDLAAWCVSIRQQLALNLQHDAPLALTYLRRLELYAWLSEDARMMVVAALGVFWIALEIGDMKLMTLAQNNIDRHDAVDDYMQKQIRQSLIPGSAYKQAWKGKYEEAAHLVELYAPLLQPGHSQAFRWSELAMFFASSYSLSGDRSMRTKAYEALKHVRTQLNQPNTPVEHENDVLFRTAIAALAIEKFDLIRDIMSIMQNSTLFDKRVHVMLEALDVMIDYWHNGGVSSDIASALEKLKDNNMGNMYRVIGGLPLPKCMRDPNALTYDPLPPPKPSWAE
jgi:hypothetical protein